MLLHQRVRLDVSRFQNGQGAFGSNGASSLVCIRDEDTEQRLAEPGQDDLRLPNPFDSIAATVAVPVPSRSAPLLSSRTDTCSHNSRPIPISESQPVP